MLGPDSFVAGPGHFFCPLKRTLARVQEKEPTRSENTASKRSISIIRAALEPTSKAARCSDWRWTSNLLTTQSLPSRSGNLTLSEYACWVQRDKGRVPGQRVVRPGCNLEAVKSGILPRQGSADWILPPRSLQKDAHFKSRSAFAFCCPSKKCMRTE